MQAFLIYIHPLNFTFPLLESEAPASSERRRLLRFSEDSGTFVPRATSARLQLQGLTCCAARLRNNITFLIKTFHFSGRTMHQFISISSLHFLCFHPNPKYDINKWKLICFPRNAL